MKRYFVLTILPLQSYSSTNDFERNNQLHPLLPTTLSHSNGIIHWMLLIHDRLILIGLGSLLLWLLIFYFSGTNIKKKTHGVMKKRKENRAWSLIQASNVEGGKTPQKRELIQHKWEWKTSNSHKHLSPIYRTIHMAFSLSMMQVWLVFVTKHVFPVP